MDNPTKGKHWTGEAPYMASRARALRSAMAMGDRMRGTFPTPKKTNRHKKQSRFFTQLGPETQLGMGCL